MAEAGPCGVSMMNSDSRFEFVNEALAEGLGYHVADLIGSPWIDVVFPEDRQAVLEAVDNVTFIGRFAIQCRLAHRDGKLTNVELLFTTRKGANNTDSGLFCFCKAIDVQAVTIA